jgi:hypothetical protein
MKWNIFNFQHTEFGSRNPEIPKSASNHLTSETKQRKSETFELYTTAASQSCQSIIGPVPIIAALVAETGFKKTTDSTFSLSYRTSLHQIEGISGRTTLFMGHCDRVLSRPSIDHHMT